MKHGHPNSTDHSSHPPKKDGESSLRLVAWETTRNCNLDCIHCRASATTGPHSGELDTAEAFRLLDQIAEIAKPIIILTGGEPLLRDDIFDIAAYGTKIGLRMVMAPNGTLVTEPIAKKLVDSGIKRISVSLDGATRESHDKFRKVEGAFDGALNAMKIARKIGLDFQVNTTITKTNLDQIPKIQQLAVEQGAVAHHIFLLVPTGRGKYIVDTAINAAEYE
jgi:AdoMet-dependent heme synthase